ncbi:MAG: M15 family metallopeptidase [Propionibacteriaceae bacterium]|nr:M15 family metallopeptidase [Propionibacteriaceae bacterium]
MLGLLCPTAAPAHAVEFERPAISGTAKVGFLLRAMFSGWGSPAFTWLRDGKAIKGAVANCYWLTAKDLGHKVAVRVTVSAHGEKPKAKTSKSVTVKTSNTGAKLTEPFIVKGIWVVSKQHRVKASYIKMGKGLTGSDKEASDAFKKMQKAAKKAGHSIYISQGYRSFATQKAIYKRNVRILGKNQGMAAPPGGSEHNLGLAFDLRSGSARSYAFGRSAAGKWVARNAWKYGFIMRYPKGKTKITGFNYEPWHFRYIGTAHSKAFKGSKLTLEEYLGLV